MDAETYIVKHWVEKKVWRHLAWPRHQERLRRCAELMPAEGPCLDLGCACGHSTMYLRDFRPDLKWAGADFSKTALTYAWKLFRDIPFYLVETPADVRRLPAFEGVVCSEVIEHTPDDASLADGLLAIARRTIVVTTPRIRVSDPGHLRVYTKEKLLALFTRAGAPAELEIREWEKFYFLIIRKKLNG